MNQKPWNKHIFLLLAFIMIGASITRTSNAFIPADTDWQSTGKKTVIQVTHDSVINPIDSGRWRLSGVLEVEFVGRVDPHENSRLLLVGPEVEDMEGRFDEVRLPEGWLYDLDYNDSAKTVILSNLRPDRRPAFPEAEGFGKYTIGGRGGKVFEVTNLNDSNGGGVLRGRDTHGNSDRLTHRYTDSDDHQHDRTLTHKDAGNPGRLPYLAAARWRWTDRRSRPTRVVAPDRVGSGRGRKALRFRALLESSIFSVRCFNRGPGSGFHSTHLLWATERIPVGPQAHDLRE